MVKDKTKQVDVKTPTRRTYISHNAITGEVYYDRFNIDYLRYYKLSNLFYALIGSVIGIIIWLNNKSFYEWSYNYNINTTYLIFVLGGIFWFLVTAIISYFAVGSFQKATRIAGRRGLFTFVIMLVVAISSLVITKKIGWDQNVYLFVKLVMTAMIIESLFALSLDYGIPFLKGLRK